MSSIAFSIPPSLSLNKNPSLSPQQTKPFSLLSFTHSSNFHFRSLSLRASPDFDQRKKMTRRGSGAVCYSAPFSPQNLQWVCTISSVVLMLARGTAVQKSFIVPMFALQAPTSIIAWIKGEYGAWTAFLALLVRLFFFIPGELELPFIALLLVIIAPYQVMNLRGTQEGAIVSLIIAGYMAFQHFSRLGSLQKAIDRVSIVATIAIICITAVTFMLLI